MQNVNALTAEQELTAIFSELFTAATAGTDLTDILSRQINILQQYGLNTTEVPSWQESFINLVSKIRACSENANCNKAEFAEAVRSFSTNLQEVIRSQPAFANFPKEFSSPLFGSILKINSQLLNASRSLINNPAGGLALFNSQSAAIYGRLIAKLIASQ